MLTDEQIDEIGSEHAPYVDHKFARAIEAAACAERDALIAKAERSLIAAGYTDQGGEAWKPPLGPSAEPLLGRIAELERQLEDARTEANALRVNEINLEAALVNANGNRPAPEGETR